MYLTLLNRFNEACNPRDVDAIMSMMTEDCMFENTWPPPDGTPHRGQAEVRGFWQDFFRTSPHAHFKFEDIFVNEDRGAQRWVYTWIDEKGAEGHVCGADVFRFCDGLIAEKRSYVKG